MTDDEIDAAWSSRIAAFVTDALMTAKIVAEKDLERATAIVAEEILVRLTIRDRPDRGNWHYSITET